MGRLETLIGREVKWVHFFPESVPHLLHLDLAYSYVLDRDEQYRPQNWARKIRAWEKLLGLFLLNRLRLQETRLYEDTFGRHLKAAGLDRVGWLYFQSDPEPVGVLSPTVLVRPLPDAGTENRVAEHLPDPWADDGSLPQLLRLVQLLRTSLSEAAKDAPLLKSLLSAVDALAGKYSHVTHQAPATTSVTIRVLKRPPLGFGKVETLELQVWQRSEKGSRPFNLFTPTCGREDCGRPLTRAESSAPVPVRNQKVSLHCESCGHDNELDLSNFMIWYRNESLVIVWLDRKNPGQPSTKERFPPEAKVSEHGVTFEWSAADVAPLGDPGKRFIKLRFDAKLQATTFQEVAYHKLLVFGPPQDAGNFPGWPVRPEWVDAVEMPLAPQWRQDWKRVNYSNLKLKGWPFAFDWAPECELLSDAVLGIFPKRAHQRRRYRVFLAGQQTEAYEVSVLAPSEAHATGRSGFERHLKGVRDVASGWPQVVAVRRSDNPNVGVTWVSGVGREQREAGPREPATLVVAVDFGTLNTVVHFARGDGTELFTVKDNAFDPSDIWRDVEVLLGDGSRSRDTAFAPPKLDNKGHDKYLVPSAVWLGAEPTLIRWSAAPPFDGAKGLTGFKWRGRAVSEGHPEVTEAKASELYLRELLFLCIPQALRRLALTNNDVELKVGYGFPLAFGHEERRELRQLWERVAKDACEESGLRGPQVLAVNESLANVLAFGSQPLEIGQTAMVADLGGGTLDVTLCAFAGGSEWKYHQIGSLLLGGKDCLEAIAGRDNGGSELWKIMDCIQTAPGRAAIVHYRGADKAVDRFIVLAMEYLRVMVEAHAKDSPNSEIQFFPVGNGWRLMAAASRETRNLGENALLNGRYDYFAKHVSGAARLVLFNFGGSEDLKDVALRKHLVVRGILRNVLSQSSRDESAEENVERQEQRLPAGRDFEVIVQSAKGKRAINCEWHRLVGPHVALAEGMWEVLGTLVHEPSGPEMGDLWLQIWQATFPDACPDHELKDALLQSIRQEGHKLTVAKGPLQLLVERWWKYRLAEREGRQ